MYASKKLAFQSYFLGCAVLFRGPEKTLLVDLLDGDMKESHCTCLGVCWSMRICVCVFVLYSSPPTD